MTHAADSVLIVLKGDNPKAVALGGEVEAWLRARGVEARIESCPDGGLSFDPPPGAASWDLILVLGGDGTLINVARAILHTGVPIMGVNLGKVGFLAEIPAEEWRERLADVLDKGFEVRRRTAMEFEVLRGGAAVQRGVVVNDLVIGRGSLARLVHLTARCNGERVAAIRADGLIISTPIGSTAYTVSAGGPVIHPDLQCFCLTPICPFLNHLRPLVLPADSEFSLRVEDDFAGLYLTLDGQSGEDLVSGDEVVIRRSPQDLFVATRETGGYFAKLREKGFVTEGGR